MLAKNPEKEVGYVSTHCKVGYISTHATMSNRGPLSQISFHIHPKHTWTYGYTLDPTCLFNKKERRRIICKEKTPHHHNQMLKVEKVCIHPLFTTDPTKKHFKKVQQALTKI